jgi:outer membrane lipoprotein
MIRKLGLNVLTMLMLLVAGCSPFPKSVLQQVDEQLTFKEVQMTPDSFIGKKILWGGVIIKTTNTPVETLMNIRQTNLDIDTRPKDLDRSQGRFLVRYGGFLDPAIYAEGREITVFGEIRGKEDMALDETRYTYPVIRSEELHLWEKRQISTYYDPWLWDYYPYPRRFGPTPYRWHRW